MILVSKSKVKVVKVKMFYIVSLQYFARMMIFLELVS